MNAVPRILKIESTAWMVYKAAALALLLAGAGLSVFGQEGDRCYCGSVVDRNGAVIPGARVTDEGTGNVAVTDALGEFGFKGMAAGRRRIVVRADGFETASVEIAFPGRIELTLQGRGVAELVTVTATSLAGTAEALETRSGSFQRIDSDELGKSRLFDFGEALRKLPGLVVRDEEGFGLRPNIGIRGTNPTRSSKVLLLEDGLPLAYAPYGDNASYYHPPVERFDSIEVLKGSGQIEYGPVTVAGVVNYITPNPTDNETLSIGLSGGNRDFLNVNGLFTGTLRGTGLVVNLNRKQGEGARENVRTGLTDLSAKIVRTLQGRHAISAKFSWFDEGSQVGYSGLTESEFAADPRGNVFLNDRFEGDRVGVSLVHSALISASSSLTTSLYLNRFSRDWWRQSSSSTQRPNRLNLDPDCRSMADLLTTCGNEGRLRDYLNVGIEPVFSRSDSFGGIRSELKAGGRLHRETQDRIQKNGDKPTARDGVAVEDNFRENRAASLFLQNRFIFGDLAVTLGLRYESIGYKRSDRLTGASGLAEVRQFIPGVGVTYNLLGNTTVFAGAHRGFAPPRTEDVISNAGGVIELDSELSWNYEAGFRTRPHDSLSLDVSWFRTRYGNQIVPASIAGGAGSAFTNGGKTLHEGIEAAARFDSARLFGSRNNVYVNVGYTGLARAEFVGARFSGVSGFGSRSVTGNRLPYAPRQTLNASAGYARGPWDLFLEANAISRQFSDDLNTVDPVPSGQRGAIPGQTYLNATVNYRPEPLKATIFVSVKNLAGRTFVVDRSRGILPSMPRTVLLGLSMKF